MDSFIRIGLILCALATTAFSPAPRAPLRQEDLQAITAVAQSLRTSILHRDLAAIANLVSVKDGLRCTDSFYPRAKVVSDLHNQRSFLYMSLFDGARFAQKCGGSYPRQFPATSELAFFSAAPNGQLDIQPAGPGYATVQFISPTPDFYPRDYTLKKEAGHWRLVDGFIIANCGCG